MSQKAKKFGAFSGVFTPSILTILGVIMYLRLGWVAGVSGIAGVLAIIFLAHLISITTGLSISSIATDKKIKAGGIYYILSRSLGLPMGGSIGITLFVGTALSISLYIVGFTENFLSFEWIQQSLNLPGTSIDQIRLVGSIVLILLVLIAYISTNFAIKTQFFILGAIALSLVSIVVGIYLHTHGTHLSATSPSNGFQPFKDFSFTEVFAIFFPAVTGFTAGVAMSGDLKNPQKDIPKGTLYAIGTGLIVYVGLALLFNLTINRNTLIENYNFLYDIAWFPWLVTAGIWGATLSSALGGILGGPRILQAMSIDHITPKIFGKTFGKNNEPRNALLFTFVLSEMGILIGDLNAIASLVTIFYLTAYGFINLAFLLEKWASTDFRPSFGIPGWIGLTGFIASLMIMFKLDMVAMFASFLILGTIFYFIRKKQLHLDMGDVWPSVLASLIRSVLTRFTRMKLSEDHWRANILLFSGEKDSRPYLIEFSKLIAGKHGLISNFDLVPKEDALHLFPEPAQAIPDEEMDGDEVVFKRRQACRNIYEGIETLAATYGFSGVEPNTVVLGWGRQTSNPIRFAQMLRYLENLDMNIVLLDYDKNKGFGAYQNIDVWLRGGSNNGKLIFALIKYVHMAYAWHNAKIRLLIIADLKQQKKKIKKRLKDLLSQMRMDAEIQIILNNEGKDVHHIIRETSAQADLIFMGLAEVIPGKESEFIARSDQLYKNLGTVALVKASGFFSELPIGDE